MAKKIIIFGPTCSGKSSLADIIAAELNAITINSDSMQLYNEIPIISAQPDNYSKDHKLFAFLKGDQNYTSADWRDQAEAILSEQIERDSVIVGGTGLYLKALLTGFKDLPGNTEGQRQEIDDLLKTRGVQKLYEEILAKDPDYKNLMSLNDVQRVRRVYGLLFIHDISYQQYQALPNISKYKPEDFLKIYIKPERDKLYHDIDIRVEQMLAMGAEDEVKAFLAHKYPATGNVYKAIGISEIAKMLSGELSKDAAISLMKKNTRNYAKRQMTFFNHQIKADIVIANNRDFKISSLN